jgi:hypothetical protein
MIESFQGSYPEHKSHQNKLNEDILGTQTHKYVNVLTQKQSKPVM